MSFILCPSGRRYSPSSITGTRVGGEGRARAKFELQGKFAPRSAIVNGCVRRAVPPG